MQRGKHKAQATSCLFIRTGPFIMGAIKQAGREGHLMGIQKKMVNYILLAPWQCPFLEWGAAKEVIYISGNRSVATFLDTHLIDGAHLHAAKMPTKEMRVQTQRSAPLVGLPGIVSFFSGQRRRTYARGNNFYCVQSLRILCKPQVARQRRSF